jgi:hypothetical protein
VADNLTNTAETNALNWLTGNSTTAPSGALKLRLMTANGNDTTGGTQVTGGSYTSQTVTFSAASSGSTSNTGAVTYTGMPACTVTGAEIWDSAGTPVRWWYGALNSNKVVAADDTFTVSSGELTLTLS